MKKHIIDPELDETLEIVESTEEFAEELSDASADDLAEEDSIEVLGDAEGESFAASSAVDELPWDEDGSEARAEVDVMGLGEEMETPPVGDEEASMAPELSVEGTELEGFESADIVDEEEIPEDRVVSIVESMLFATDKPQSIAVIKQAFKGTKVRSHHIRRAIEALQVEYAGGRRGVCLEEIAGGYQLRTKLDNLEYLKRTVKAKPFKLSGPALEVLAIVAYKQPLVKSQIDEIRGVESGHLLRALMEKNLVHFEGKSELPGKPMLYGTTRKFLETFSLRNIKELPSLAEIDELIPEGIGAEEDKETLSDVGDRLAQGAVDSYSTGEDELEKINVELEKVQTTTEFFEQEKARMRAERDRQRAQDLIEALAVGEEISVADQRWLDRYQAVGSDSAAVAEQAVVGEAEIVTEEREAQVLT